MLCDVQVRGFVLLVFTGFSFPVFSEECRFGDVEVNKPIPIVQGNFECAQKQIDNLEKDKIDKVLAELSNVNEKIKDLISINSNLESQITELRNLKTIPNGAVVAFLSNESNPCPGANWKIYEGGKGRFIIGAGQSNTTKLSSRKLSETGGQESHSLGTAEMPKHTHRISTDNSNNVIHNGLGGSTGDYGILQTFADIPNKKGWTTVLPAVLEETGGGPSGAATPHNNMPPFVALYFCIKTEAN